MSIAFQHRVFSKITTMGKLPDGRIIEQTKSYPHGADYEEYMRLDEALVVAFGSINSRTIGEPFHGQRAGRLINGH